MRIRHLVFAAMVAAAVAAGPAPALAATKPPKQTLTLTEYQIAPALQFIAKGKSNFVAKNTGTVKHEVVIVRGTDPSTLPTKPDGSVDEDQIPKRDKVGETGNAKPGKTKSKTLKLSAGYSILFCNIIDTEPDGSQVSHFAKGMYTTINASCPRSNDHDGTCACQLTIPTDNVDGEMLRRPAHWDIAMIRRFMLFFGPISSIFDFLTFGIMLGVFGAGPALFRSGWFVESLATQTLVIFVIRTRRTPFFRSRPSRPLLLASFGCVTLGAALPFTPVADALGFQPLPVGFFVALVLMVAAYLTLVEVGKGWFFSHQPAPVRLRRPRRERRVQRRAARWSHATPLTG